MTLRPSILLMLAVCLMGAVASRAGEIRVDNARDSDPELKWTPPRMVFNPDYKPLWIKALRRPEADMQRMAAESIAQAHAFGFPDMADARPDLRTILIAAGTHPAARFAAARALIVLDTRAAGQVLFETAQQSGSQLRQLVEPAVAEWDYQPARAVWLKRLDDPETNRRELLLAIRGLGKVGERLALPSLLTVVHDPVRSADVRLAAAHAAGFTREEGLEDEVTRLIERKTVPILHRLCAIALLDRHRSEEARARLLHLAQDDEPSVAAAALARLLAIDPALVLPVAEAAMQNPDANVRQRGADAYIALPTPERVVFLSRLLDDVHPGVRGNIREALFRLAKSADLDVPIRQSGMQVLGQESWRGQEQATLLLSALDHKPAVTRFVALLESSRGEVAVTAAWGLRKLAVPETLPAIFDKARRQTELREGKGPAPPELDAQTAQLCEALGMMQYKPADPLLRKYVPKDFTYGYLSRPAAIWALGHIHSGIPDEALAQLLMARLLDQQLPPESSEVKQMSAVTLARMKAVSQVPAMRKWLAASGGPLADPGLLWALTQLTGEKFPVAPPGAIGKSGWFLEPLTKPAPASSP